MNPIDTNPRTFYIDVVGIDANVDADATTDMIVIEFAGRVTPTIKRRISTALSDGDFVLQEKKLA